mgnify:CR=1 FL=1
MKKFDWTKGLIITLILTIIISIGTDLIAFYLIGITVRFRDYILSEIVALILAIDYLALYLKYKKLKNS